MPVSMINCFLFVAVIVIVVAGFLRVIVLTEARACCLALPFCGSSSWRGTASIAGWPLFFGRSSLAKASSRPKRDSKTEKKERKHAEGTPTGCDMMTRPGENTPSEGAGGKEALEWGDWLALAYDRGLILRARDYPALVPGNALLVVPIDMAVFEQSDEAAYDGTLPMDAATFFGHSVEVVVPTGRAWLSGGNFEVAVPPACLEAPWSPGPNRRLVVADYHCLAGPSAGGESVRDTIASEPDRAWRTEPGLPDFWLSDGSGDGWTRYMRWDDVLKMPPVYLDKTETDNDGDGHDDVAHDRERALEQRARSGRGPTDATLPCSAIMTEVERILDDAVARREPQQRVTANGFSRLTRIVPVWLEDANAYLASKHAK